MDEGDLFAGVAVLGADEGDEFLVALVFVFGAVCLFDGRARRAVASSCFLSVVKDGRFWGSLRFWNASRGVVSGVGHLGEQLRLERAEGVGVFC